MGQDNKEIQELAAQFLLALKTNRPFLSIVESLKKYNFQSLEHKLTTDTQKIAFWINSYNAIFQYLRKEKGLNRPTIFRDEHFEIAGHKFSLDGIEHGILRKYRYKPSLGYLPDPFAPKLIKQLAVDKIDYRIHFALNCGAKSCPPIAFYHPDQLNKQLDLATLSFLESETTIDHPKKQIKTTQLFRWYLGDFGGMKGVRNIISTHLNLDLTGYKIGYNAYSWDEYLDNYSIND